MEKFEFSEKMSALAQIRKELASLSDEPLLKDNLKTLEETLRHKDEDETLRVAVCGQYSAGKSTLVHALTNDDTIEIGQDVTTDKVKEYNWNGIKIADTPGIYAGREDHDALSKEYIRKADLLIYMITIQGFTREIGKNFKTLVQGEYADKTMLLMNKRNQEPAENEVNWIRDTRDFLGGDEMLKKFYFSIVDIEDYLIGKKENEPELVAESHFEEFWKKLNNFIDERQLMGKVTSRKNCIDAFLDLYIQDFSQKRAKDEFTRRQKLAINNAISACNKAFSDASLRMRTNVRTFKNELVGLLADETIKEFQTKAENAELALEAILDDPVLKNDIETAVKDLQSAMEGIDFDATQYEEELKRLAAKFHGANTDMGGTIDLGPLKSGMQGISKYLSTLTKDGLVKFVHFFGGKFKPWGATKWLNWLKGAGKWLGPLAALVDVASLIMDKKHQEEMAGHRRELSNMFSEIENGISAELDKVKDDDGFLIKSLKRELESIEQREAEQEALHAHKEGLLATLKGIKSRLALI